MIVLLDFLPAVLSGGALGLAIYANHRLRMLWILAMRREHLLGRLVGDAGEALMKGMEFEDFCKLWDRRLIPIADEVHNQLRHRGDFWQRVPDLGKPWRDFEPAEMMRLEADE